MRAVSPVICISQQATAQCKLSTHCVSRTSDSHTDLDHIIRSVQPYQLLRLFSSSPLAQLTPAVCRQLVTRIYKLHFDLTSLRHIIRSSTLSQQRYVYTSTRSDQTHQLQAAVNESCKSCHMHTQTGHPSSQTYWLPSASYDPISARSMKHMLAQLL